MTSMPKTESEFTAWCEERADRIFVREQVEGKWGSHALSALSPERRAYWIHRWWSEGRLPIVVVAPSVSTKKDPKLNEIRIEESEVWCSECGSSEIFDRRCRACGSRNISRYDRIRIPETKES